ncbi:hypothetical protein [Chitinophaga flava]|nr:hypothetical protein [Chitinophaga flava]
MKTKPILKPAFLITTLVLSLTLSAQERPMFDSLKVDNNTKLIGYYPPYDKAKTSKHLNFYIDNPAEIKTVMTELTTGAEVQNSMENPPFFVSIIQNYSLVKSWIVNPTLKSALYDGHTYKFDIEKVKKLSKKYPFDYKMEKVTFSNKEEYKQYLAKQKSDTTFLFAYSPQFRYEGSFEIQFPNTGAFSSPKAISEYLTPLIEKIVQENEYRLGYILDQKNMHDQNQFTMTITGSKKLFDNLKVDNLKSENWKPTVEEGSFFYKTK